MLDTWERRSTEEVVERIEREGGDPEAKARRAGAVAFSGQLLPIDFAVRDSSRREPPVADRLRRVDNRRMEYLRSHATASMEADSAGIAAALLRMQERGGGRSGIRARVLLVPSGSDDAAAAPAWDEDHASAGTPSAPTTLLHPWKAAVVRPLSRSMQRSSRRLTPTR